MHQLHSRAYAASPTSSSDLTLHLDSSCQPTNSKQPRPPSPLLHVRKPSMANYGVSFPAVAILVHVLGVLALALVLTWVISYRNGVSLWADDANQIFNAHPVIQLGGFIFISSEAILVYKTLSGTKKTKKLVHLSLQAIAFLFSLLGVWAAYKYHIVSNIDNFYSLHSWLGIATIILFFFQWLGGFISFWTQSVSPSTRAGYLPWHVFWGLAIYTLAIATAATGLLEKITFLNINAGVGHYASETLLVNTTGLVVILLGAVTVFAALVPTPKDDEGGYQAIN